MRTKRHKLPPKTKAKALPSDLETEAPITPTAEPDEDGPGDDDDESELVRVSDTAYTLRVSENTVREYVRQGLLDQIRIGTRTVRIKRSSLKRLMGQAAE